MEIKSTLVMKNTLKLMIVAFAAMAFSSTASAQKKSDPEGFLTYSLPSTTLVLEVEAVQERFHVGPYAKFAEKYLGIRPRQKDEATFQITEIRMTPYVEADHNRRYTLNVKKGDIDATFLKLSAEGLISFSDANFGEESIWRFPVDSKSDFAGKGVSSNLTSEYATLYHNDNNSAYDRISVHQNMLVEKSLERRAAEAADMILKLRKQRLQIVTGDTDATYSGEAMGAAVKELTRLEEEYMLLFTGYSEFQTQKMKFEVVPQAGRPDQMYVAFRLSDTAGLLTADNVSGKPILMEIIPQAFAQTEVTEEDVKDKKKPVLAYYRIPSICTVKLMNGADLLMQSRVPVYQLGHETSLPVNVILK